MYADDTVMYCGHDKVKNVRIRKMMQADLCKVFFFFSFFITEHSQVTPGLPMLQDFIYLTYVQLENL